MVPSEYGGFVDWKIDHYTKVPVFVVGPSGNGKTGIVEAICKRRNVDPNDPTNPNPRKFGFVYLNGTSMEATDLMGLPARDTYEETFKDPTTGKDVTRKIEVTRFLPPKFLKDVESYERGVLLIDEVNRAPLEVRNVLMQLLDRRTIGEVTLPDGWQIVLTANPHDTGYQVDELDEAFLRRCIIIKLVFSMDGWAEWGMTEYKSPIQGFLGAPISATVVSAARRMVKLLNKDVENEMKQVPTGFGLQVCSELAQAGLREDFEPSMVRQIFAGCVGDDLAEAVIKALSDDKLKELLDKVMQGKPVTGEKHDVYVDLLDLFWEKIYQSPKKFRDAVGVFFGSLPEDIRSVYVRRLYPFFSKKDYITDPIFEKMANDWREFCTRTMYRVKGLRNPQKGV